MSDINNMNLETASFAMECVEKVNGKDFSEKYTTLVKKMSAMIQKNGLISVLAFCYSKKGKETGEAMKNIIDWSVKNRRIKSLFNANEYSELEYIKFIVDCKPKQYRLISREMIILFGWIKRFADGMIEEKKAGSDDE